MSASTVFVHNSATGEYLYTLQWPLEHTTTQFVMTHGRPKSQRARRNWDFEARAPKYIVLVELIDSPFVLLITTDYARFGETKATASLPGPRKPHACNFKPQPTMHHLTTILTFPLQEHHAHRASPQSRALSTQP